MSGSQKSQELQILAETLAHRDRKKALSFIRKRLQNSFNSEYEQLAWKGWERALHRQESMSLIFQLVNGMSAKDAKKAFQDLKKKRTEILIRDHTQTELSKQYIHQWVQLLGFYCEFCSE